MALCHHIGSAANNESISSSKGKAAIGREGDRASTAITSSIARDKKQSALWGGTWVPPSVTNVLRSNYWLPNDVFVSSHTALGVDFVADDALLHTQWDATS